MAYGTRSTKKITLTDPEYWVEIYTNQTYGQVKSLEHLQEAEGLSAADVLLKTMIVDWNLDGPAGQLPIESESFDQILASDARLILDAINEVFVEADSAKKNSSET